MKLFTYILFFFIFIFFLSKIFSETRNLGLPPVAREYDLFPSSRAATFQFPNGKLHVSGDLNVSTSAFFATTSGAR